MRLGTWCLGSDRARGRIVQRLQWLVCGWQGCSSVEDDIVSWVAKDVLCRVLPMLSGVLEEGGPREFYRKIRFLDVRLEI